MLLLIVQSMANGRARKQHQEHLALLLTRR